MEGNRPGSLGSWLRHHREARGWSLKDVARITRINPFYLQALEEEDFTRLPAQAFTRGFVRAYAQALSLDEQEAVRRFQEAQGREGKGDPPWHREGSGDAPARGLSAPSRAAGLWMGFVGGGLVLGGILLWALQGWWLPVPLEQSSPASVQAESEGALTEEPSPVPPPMELRLVAKEDCWVRVILDGKETRTILLQAGREALWYAQDRFLVTLGNAGGVEAYLNGHPIGPLGMRGEVVRNLLISREVLGLAATPP